MINRLARLSTVLLMAGVLASCDSADPGSNNNQTSFSVRYESAGTCDGIVGANVVSVGYTVDGGGTEAKSVTMPWSETFTVTTSNNTTAVGLSVICNGSGNAANTITGTVFVGGNQRDEQSATGMSTILVSASAVLN